MYGQNSQVTRFGEAAQGANVAAERIGSGPLPPVSQHPLFGPNAKLVLAGQRERPSCKCNFMCTLLIFIYIKTAATTAGPAVIFIMTAGCAALTVQTECYRHMGRTYRA